MTTQTMEMKVFEKLKETREYEGRKVILIAKVGSVNYNLNDNLSDDDYKVYVLPKKEDMYVGNRFVKSIVGDVDFTIHDIRDLEKHLYKANINFVEVLFSVEITTLAPEIDGLVELREEIARMNLPYLYDASFSMMYNKIKTFDKGTKSTASLVEKYGYCTKSFMTMYRGLDFLLRYHKNGFTSFQEAVRYNKEEREFMLSMKHGAYSREEAYALLTNIQSQVASVKDDYRARSINGETQEKVRKLLLELVFKSLKGESE